MPCPLAPLISVIPSLPFLAWIFGKLYLNKFKKKNKDLTLKLPFSSNSLSSFEFYKNKSPDFRKKQSMISEEIENFEYLLFDNKSSKEKANSFSKYLFKFNVISAKLRDENIIISFESESDLDKFSKDYHLKGLLF